jgi:hypothetical protein
VPGRLNSTVLFCLCCFLAGCSGRDEDTKLLVVCTTGLVGDLVRTVEYADVKWLMGPDVDPHGYVASRDDGLANGQEWRTSPLWGIRLAPDALGGQATYLHDGRATSLEEAIRLHGGESAASRNGFNALGESDRTALIAFLESL